MKAYKVFEAQRFERGADPMDSMKIGDVQGRLLKVRKAEAIKAMEELLNTYGGDGPFFYDEDDAGFKIVIFQDGPFFSKFKINDTEVRYYIEYQIDSKDPIQKWQIFAGWEQEENGKWKDRQWTSKLSAFDGKDIETIEQAKQILINYIQGNKSG